MTVNVTDVDEPVVVDPPVTQPEQSTPQTVSESAGEDFSTDPSTSGRIAVGDTATGRIGSSGDRDWFAVELVSGRTYVIDLRGSPTDDGTLSDPYLRGIYDADGNRISNTTNDDGGRGYNSRLTFTATESGTHYIAAGAWSSRRGTYEVEVTDTSPPEAGGSSADPVIPEPQEPTVEFVGPDQDAQQQPETSQAQDEQVSVSEGATDLPTDTTTTGRVVVGSSATGEVEARGDQDWFAVELEAGRIYRIDQEGRYSGRGTLYDPYLRGIHDADGEWIANTSNTLDDSEGRGWVNRRVYFRPDEDGTYYVAAGSYRSYVGTYTLSVIEIMDDYAADPASVAVDDSMEFDPQADYAAGTGTGSVAVDGSATGEIDYFGDEDLFAVDLEAGTEYRIDLRGWITGEGTLYDPYLRGIYDADGERNENTTNDNGGRSRNSRVYFTPNEDATYYVGAAGADRDPTGGYGPYIIGTYTLSVTDVTDDYAADTDTTGTVTVGGSATGAIGTRGDEDWFAVELAAGTEYRIDLESSSGPGGRLENPYLRGIYDADGEPIADTSDDNDGWGLNSRVHFTPVTPDEDGTYYVAAAAAVVNHVGVYTLSVEEVDGM